MKIDFSEFHPLDHPWWRCRGYPGGLRRHLDYAWQFQWRSRLREKTLCLVGAHEWQVWYRHGRIDSVTCAHCAADPTLPQRRAAEIDARNHPPPKEWLS